MNNPVVEVHVLTWLPLSCVNRDDVGQPKSMTISGTKRGRWSSQSQKFALRDDFRKHFGDDQMSIRTKFIHRDVVAEMVALGVDRAEAVQVADGLVSILTSKTKEDGKTETLYALRNSAAEVAKFCAEHRYAFAPSVKAPKDAEFEAAKLVKKKVNGKDAMVLVLDDAVKQVVYETMISPNGLIDVALFGRMLAGYTADPRVDAASSVAHAFTTHVDDYEVDYFTAVDEGDVNGSAHVDQQAYTSGVFYRYGNVSLAELAENGVLDEKLAREVAVEFVRDFAMLKPRAKRFSTAPYTLPSLVYVTVNEGCPVSHSDAFVVPVSGDLVGESIKALSKHVDEKGKAFGFPTKGFVLIPGDEGFSESAARVASFDDLMAEVGGALG